MVAFSVAVALQMNRHGRLFIMIHETSSPRLLGEEESQRHHHHVYFYNPAYAGSWTTSTPRLVGYYSIRAVHPDPVQPVLSCPVLSLATPCPTKNPPDLCCSHGPAVDCSSFAFALPT